MTIAQRIELRRLGYTKEEVQEMVEQEKAAALEPVPGEPVEVNQADPAADNPPAASEAPAGDPTAVQLLSAINNLTLALQGHKLNTTEQPVEPPETAADIFTNMLK